MAGRGWRVAWGACVDGMHQARLVSVATYLLALALTLAYLREPPAGRGTAPEPAPAR